MAALFEEDRVVLSIAVDGEISEVVAVGVRRSKKKGREGSEREARRRRSFNLPRKDRAHTSYSSR